MFEYNMPLRKNHKKPPITLRELQVLQLAAEGLTYKEIAATLSITTGTVKKHLQHLYKKLKAGNKIEALVKMHWLQ